MKQTSPIIDLSGISYEPLISTSPIDGRYRKDVEELSALFSEMGFMAYRKFVEGEYLIYLADHPRITDLKPFSKEEKELIRNKYARFNIEDARLIKSIEMENHGIERVNGGKGTNHDLKAIEYALKLDLLDTPLEDYEEWTHFALTSEDPTSIGYDLMISDGLERGLLPAAHRLYDGVRDFAVINRGIPMLARTHGQPASPTTAGKEVFVFSNRIKNELDKLDNFQLRVKLAGASGNHNALHVAYPDIDCVEFGRQFCESFNEGRKIKLKYNPVATQVEAHDNYAELFDNIARLNGVVINLDQDLWQYISDDWIIQKPVEEEVGSSTMPHKTNPIKSENSEGNLLIGNFLLKGLSEYLPNQRFQRTLRDSALERSIGVALCHSMLGYKNALGGLKRYSVNEPYVKQVLNEHPEVISEAFQTILRREGYEMPYEKLKAATRGKKVTLEDLHDLVRGMNLSERVEKELLAITPENYVGIARELVMMDPEFS